MTSKGCLQIKHRLPILVSESDSHIGICVVFFFKEIQLLLIFLFFLKDGYEKGREEEEINTQQS